MPKTIPPLSTLSTKTNPQQMSTREALLHIAKSAAGFTLGLALFWIGLTALLLL